MKRLAEFMRRNVRAPRGVLLLIAAGVVLGVAIWLIPKQWSNEVEARRDVVTFISGAVALVLSGFVFDRLRREVARPREKAMETSMASRSASDPRVLELNGVDLREANLPAADLARVELGEALLDDADLSSATMTKSWLEGARLQRADLRKARLGCAVLDHADLRDADLRGTAMAGASLKMAKLVGAIYDADTDWPKGIDPEELGAIDVSKAAESS